MRKSILLSLTLIPAVWSHAQDSISVLFIGNSYTQVNDLPNTTRQLTESLGKELTIGVKANGGYTFQNHCNDAQTFTAMHQENWDVVVLQAQSQEPAFPDDQVDEQTIPPAIRLADSVYAINPCSNVLYYMTWGRENGDPQWAPISTFEGMNQRLYNAYMRMADSTDAMVSPVGAVWKYVRNQHPAIQLYSGDGSHPSLAGTYLAACTFYVSLFQQPVSAATYLGGLDATTAQQIRAATDIVMLDSLDHFKLHPVDEPVQAAFTFTDAEGNVQFTNTSTRDEQWWWNFDDGNTSNEEHPEHIFAAPGTYEVSLIAGNACTTDTTFQSITINIVGIDEISTLFGLKQYPDHFSITAENGPLSYEIYALSGERILSGRIEDQQSVQVAKSLNAGLIVLTNAEGKRFAGRFVRW